MGLEDIYNIQNWTPTYYAIAITIIISIIVVFIMVMGVEPKNLANTTVKDAGCKSCTGDRVDLLSMEQSLSFPVQHLTGLSEKISTGEQLESLPNMRAGMQKTTMGMAILNNTHINSQNPVSFEV